MPSKITGHTVFADLLKPVDRASNTIRLDPADGRIKSKLKFRVQQPRVIDDENAVNQGVIGDQQIQLDSA